MTNLFHQSHIYSNKAPPTNWGLSIQAYKPIEAIFFKPPHLPWMCSSSYFICLGRYSPCRGWGHLSDLNTCSFCPLILFLIYKFCLESPTQARLFLYSRDSSFLCDSLQPRTGDLDIPFSCLVHTSNFPAWRSPSASCSHSHV